MKSAAKKLLSILLALIMAFGIMATVSISAGAAESKVLASGAYYTSGNYKYKFLDDGTIIIAQYLGRDVDLIIPSEIDGYSVTKIGGSAFSGRSSLTSIEIPNSVTTIGDSAFFGCKSLTSIKIPNSVTYIAKLAFSDTVWYNNQPDGVVYAGKVAYKYKGTMPENTTITLEDGTVSISPYAFENCTGLTSIEIPNSVTTVGIFAFNGCTALTSIKISNSVTAIASWTFSGCKSLTSIEIPNSVTTINSYAFLGCKSLTSIEIPNSVTTIGDSAFWGCTCLTSIEIPNSVTTIGSYTFAYCTDLTSVKIPNSINSICEGTFCGCKGLTSIKIPKSVNEISDYAFFGCTNLTLIEILDNVTFIAWMAFGYYDDDSSGEYKKIDGFTIYGYPDTAAEAYANDNGFTFIALESKRLLGDTNGDEKINLADAILTMKHSVKLTTLTGNDLLAADVNGDGDVKLQDAIILQKYSLGFDTEFPIGKAM